MADTGTAAAMRARWGAWTDGSVLLPVPADWHTIELPMQDAPALSVDAIDRALDEPVGAATLETLAAGRSRVAIAIDDITRPTRTAPLLSRLIGRLEHAGIATSAMTIIIATGAHRPASTQDVRLKVGEAAGRVRVVSHDPVASVDDTGVPLAGQPVRVNREFLTADLRISIGGIMPHPFAGFSGGGKIVLPGLADLDTVVRSHKYALMGFGGGLGLEGNKFRNDMERAVRAIGLDWTINVVANSRCETAAVVAGDLRDAHRAAVLRARAVGATRPPDRPLDALVVNAYPKDSELLQIEAALVCVRAGMVNWLHPGAPVVLVAACPDGLGSHQLFGPGGRLFRRPATKPYLAGRTLHIVSPATAADTTRGAFAPDYPYHQTWESCAAALAMMLPASPTIGFVPNGPLHVPVVSAGAQQTEAAAVAVRTS